MLADLYLISHIDFIDLNFNPGHGIAIYLTMGFLTMRSIFSITPGSNAFTSQPSLARRHLHSRKGFWSTYPGLNSFLVYIFVTVLIVIPARPIFAEEDPTFVSNFSRLFFEFLLTNLHTAWVRAVISKPSKKSIWQRLPDWREWIAITPAASLDIVLPKSVYHLANRFRVSMGYRVFGELSSSQEKLGNIAFLAIAIVFEYMASIFTRKMYIRVAASMLPD